MLGHLGDATPYIVNGAFREYWRQILAKSNRCESWIHIHYFGQIGFEGNFNRILYLTPEGPRYHITPLTIVAFPFSFFKRSLAELNSTHIHFERIIKQSTHPSILVTF